MRRLRIVLAVVAPALSLLAQTPGSSPDKSSPDHKEGHPESVCRVSGRVVTAAEGSPLKSARVALIPQPQKSDSRVYTAMSDGDGRFLLKDVPPGRYQFLAMRAGFVEQHYQPQGTLGEALLSLKLGEKPSDVLFRMTVAAVISGRITNEDGEPMIAVRVVAMRRLTEEEMEEQSPFTSQKPAPIPVATGRTDDRGQYRIFGLKPGEYYIRASDSFDPDPYSGGIPVGEEYWVRQEMGSEYGPVYYPGVGRLGQAEVVSVRAGDEAQADFSMQRIKTVEMAGRVVGPEGPVRGIQVFLEASGEDDFLSNYQTTTDEKGNFSMKGVPPGSYVIALPKKQRRRSRSQGARQAEGGSQWRKHRGPYPFSRQQRREL